MKKLALMAGLLVLAGMAFSQGYGPCGYGCYNWDSSKLVWVEGKLISVAPTQIRLRVEAQNRVYNLYMGPYWYFSRIGLRLNTGDVVKVRGYVLQTSAGYNLYVAEVVKDGKTYRLRDQNGRPLWWDYRGRGQGAAQSGKARGMGRGRRGGSGRW